MKEEDEVNEEKSDGAKLDDMGTMMMPEVPGGETSKRSWMLVGGRMGMGMETRCFPLSKEAGPGSLCSPRSSPV